MFCEAMGQRGFTLIELVIGMGILLVAILGILAAYNHSLLLGRYSEEYLLAMQSAQSKLEEMRGHDFNRLRIDYVAGGNSGNTFDPAGLTGKGTIVFDATDPTLLGVRIIVSWTEKGRLFGEGDTDSDGTVDASEDRNGNGQWDSPVELVTYLTAGG